MKVSLLFCCLFGFILSVFGQISSGCFLLDEVGVQLELFTNKVQFEVAKNSCKDQDKVLARIDNLELFNAAASLVAQNPDGIRAWLGMFDPVNAFNPILPSETIDTSRYVFVDGEIGNRAFIEEASAFPWFNGEPDNDNGNSNCILIKNEGNPGFADARCTSNRPYICRSSCDLLGPPISSECLNNSTKLELFTEKVTFEEAKSSCKEKNMVLARIDNTELFNAAASLVAQNSNGMRAWLGMFDPVNEFNPVLPAETMDTSRFVFVDGEIGNRKFLEDPGEFPWLGGDPDNHSGNSNCIVLLNDGVPGLKDANCASERPYICSSSC